MRHVAMSPTSSPFLTGLRPVALLALSCFIAGGVLGAAIVASLMVSGTSTLSSELATASERVTMLEEVLRQQATDGRYALVTSPPDRPLEDPAQAAAPPPVTTASTPEQDSPPAMAAQERTPSVELPAAETASPPDRSAAQQDRTKPVPASAAAVRKHEQTRDARAAPSNKPAAAPSPAPAPRRAQRASAEPAAKVRAAKVPAEQPTADRPQKDPANPRPSRPVFVAAVPSEASTARVVAPHPASTATEERERLEAVPAAKAGVQRIEPGAVIMLSGTRVGVGETFASGERLISTDPARGKIVTSDRTLLIL